MAIYKMTHAHDTRELVHEIYMMVGYN